MIGIFDFTEIFMDRLKNDRKAKPIEWLAVAAFVAVYVILANVIGNISIGDQLMFLAAQLVFVLIPGMAVTLVVNAPNNRIGFLIVSYMTGFGVVIGEYFLFNAVGLGGHMLICMAAVPALSIYAIYKKRAKWKLIKSDARAEAAYGAYLGAMLIVILAVTLTAYNTPDLSKTGSSYIYQDLTWNVGNTVSLSNGMPVMDIHVDGFTFGYHFFINAFLAPFKNILGISAYTLYVKLLPIVQVVIFTGGMYMLFSLLFKNKWACIGVAGVATMCSALIMQHMLWYAFATPVSMGLVLAAAYYFIRFSKKMDTATIRDRDFIMFMILLVVATGIKTLLAVGVIAGAGILILAQILYRRKNIRHMIAAGVILVAAVAGLYFGLVYGTHAYNSLQRAFAAPMWMGAPPEYYLRALEIFPGLPDIVVKIMCYPIYMVENYLVLVVAVILILTALGKKKAASVRIRLFLLSGIICGFVAASVIYQPGMSNLFFMEGTLPLCVFALFMSLNENRENGKLDNVEKTAFSLIIAAVFAFNIILNINILRNDYTNGMPAVGRTGATSPYDSITEGQYEGMLWLKNETDGDAVFVSDRQYYTPSGTLADARYYYYTAFSERQCYLEGYNYVSVHNANFREIIDDRSYTVMGAYSNDPASLEQLVSDGVDYIVATRFIHPDFVLAPEYGEMVFENGDIAIYELNGEYTK